MDAALLEQPRDRRFDLPDRGGVMTAMEMGPREQPVDIVFCHANGFNALTYRSILEPLARDCRILAANSTRSWARIPRDGGHGFHGIVGAL